MNNLVIKILKSGGIGVLPTDTIYGLVGSALNRETVERIYAVRKRSPEKASIILIGSLKDLATFGINPARETIKILKSYWDLARPTSIVLPCSNKKLDYLHRGTNSLAFRLPHNKELLQLLKKTGPLIAPSANPEGLPPASTIKQARAYFGPSVDFYIAGRSNKKPSKLIKIENGVVEVLRK